jgi:hypothetical protein
VLERVGQQVGDDAFEQRAVGADLRQLRVRRLDPDAVLAARQARDGRGEHFLHVERGQARLEGAGLHAGHVEEVLDEVGQAGEGLVGDLQQLRAVRRRRGRARGRRGC